MRNTKAEKVIQPLIYLNTLSPLKDLPGKCYLQFSLWVQFIFTAKQSSWISSRTRHNSTLFPWELPPSLCQGPGYLIPRTGISQVRTRTRSSFLDIQIGCHLSFLFLVKWVTDSFLLPLTKDEKQLLKIALYFSGFCFLKMVIFLHLMSHLGLKHSLIYHPDHSSLEFWKIYCRMDYKEEHTYLGNMGGQIDPGVNVVVEIGMGMPTPL